MNYDPRVKFILPLLLSCAASAGPIRYAITDLGSLGGTYASAYGINQLGQTAGSATTANGTERALASGADASPAGATDAAAHAINSNGQLAGTVYLNGVANAAVWTGDSVQYLARNAYGTDINEFGQVTGMFVDSSGQGHAFLSDGSTLLQDLGVLAGGSWASGYGINSGAQVVGYGDTSSGAFRAFSWTSVGGMVQMGTLGGANSYAMDVNDAGQVTGHAQTRSGYLHAFVATAAGMMDLGTLGGTTSTAFGINNNGAVVGASSNQSGESRAFVYQNGSMLDLNSLLVTSGWLLSAAYDINASGQIAGSGFFGGEEHAFVLTPVEEEPAMPMAFSAFRSAPVIENPEPATLTLFATGLIALGIYARRRTH